MRQKGDGIMRRGAFACLGTAAGLLLLLGGPASVASAQIFPSDRILELETVASGLAAPLGVTHAGDGSGRLFVYEQTGQIRILVDDVLLATPFLDISSELPALNPFFDERGLLGVAFHPNYVENGRGHDLVGDELGLETRRHRGRSCAHR